MLNQYDLIYYPAGTMLLQYDEKVSDIAYAGPSPIKYKQLEKPANIIMLENVSRNNHSKVWHEGEIWYVKG